MNTKHIDGTVLARMLENGLNHLRNHEKEINDMNVFPVPDGDTGINMRLTLENGLKRAEVRPHLGEYLRDVSAGMLLGARGNSGVILSQLFQGMAQSLARDGIVNVNEMSDALVAGYKAAYRAVIRPVEGTILTVAREGIENVRQQSTRGMTFENLFSLYLAEMRKSLSFTPEVLTVLKEAGVVDSGAYGYITIVEGMVKALYGETVVCADGAPVPETPVVPDANAFNADSEFTFGYCMEFILQLMNGPSYNRRFRLDAYIDDLKSCGDSLVALQDKTRVKVHIHTKKPARIITLSQEYGEFITFKLENMQFQHNEHQAAKEPVITKPLGLVAVANGDGIKALLTDLGVDIVLDGGDTMNTPAEEFVRAYRRLDVSRVVVLPNNKNVIRAAEQAAKITEKTNVTVLPTESAAEAYFALAMDVGDETPEKRVELMTQGMNDATTLAVAVATKAYTANGVSCVPGDYLVLKDGEPAAAGQDFSSVLQQALATVEDLDEKESAIVFTGRDASTELSDTLLSLLEDVDLEATPFEGGQGIYLFVIGL